MKAMTARARPWEMSISAVSAAQLSRKAAARIETPKMAASNSGFRVEVEETEDDPGRAESDHQEDEKPMARAAGGVGHAVRLHGVGHARHGEG
ncbi:MAG: hypothetical protein IPG47_00995 [Thermoflexaceae bacterium]|nr:hypothetical protein [Thermoflexaceae bacterium]